MPNLGNVNWLHNLFGAYDFYYLDPSIVKNLTPPHSENTRSGRLLQFLRRKPSKTPWFSTDIKAGEALVQKLKKIVGIKDENYSVDEFFEDGTLQNLLHDRSKQRQVANAILEALSHPTSASPKAANIASHKSLSAKRKFDSIQKLREEGKHLGELPNRNTLDCLIVVDGVINRVDQETHHDLYSLVQVTPEVQDRYTRLVRFMLSDVPWPLMWLDAHCIGLRVDQKALMRTYSDTSENGYIDVVGLDGWYPFAKVIGFWRTDRGGRPFVDVLVILVKSFPTINEMLQQHAGGPKKKMLEMLEDGLANVQKELTTLRKKKRAPYYSQCDYSLPYPLLLTCLCCGLNGIDMNQFQARAPLYHSIFQEYRDALGELARVLRARQAPSLLPSFMDQQKQTQIRLLSAAKNRGL